MKLIRIGAAAVNQTPMDWEGNRERIVGAIARARDEGVSILALPELALCGYGCEDAFVAPSLLEATYDSLEQIAPHTRDMCVAIGLPIYLDKALYNCAALLVDGQLAGLAAKQFLAGDGIHYEPRWFKAWPAGVRDIWRLDSPRLGRIEVPIGDLLFEIGGVRIGFEICEDAWVANRPGATLARRGVDVLLNPSASHFAFGKFAVRERFVTDGSRAFGAAYVYSNLLGNEAGRIIYDGGCMIASGGELLARGERLSFRDLELTCATIDVESNRREQARRSAHDPTLIDPNIVRLPFTWPKTPLIRHEPLVPTSTESCASPVEHKHEEFTRAVALGLWDYLRKSGSLGFALSLSGGADSSACAVLVRAALEYACAERSPEAVAQFFVRNPTLAQAISRGQLDAAMNELLWCAYQPTDHSGPVTQAAAEAIARAVGAKFFVLPVQSLVDGYRAMAERAVGRALSWDQDDIALQNIQARVRAPSIWMLANLRQAILLTTSNRSEAAMGYATMDGDTAGGLAPLGGIDKTYLRQYLRWREHNAPAGLAPIRELSLINQQAPTAELRPSDGGINQTDEADLMPYDVLEAIEDASIRDKYPPVDVLDILTVQFPQHPREMLIGWIRRFFELWCRNQWKRERLAPSFHLDDRNLDPRSWCRFPILSGGYRTELAQLR